MRIGFLFALLCVAVPSLRAQQQERRLIDRVLKPDMELQNSAQNKKFIGKSKVSEKSATVQSFYISRKPETKEFNGRREYSATEFAAHHFRDGEMTSTSQARAARVKKFSFHDGTGTLNLRDMPDSQRKIASSEFAGTEPFLEKGKSQKALSQHPAPLTIEQVRELLNKNK